MTLFNLGSINRDLVYSVDHFVQAGETLACQARHDFAGGKGYNQSIALAAGGARVVHIGAVGSDGAELLAQLNASNVQTQSIEVCPECPTGHAIIQVNPDGQNCILIHPGANHKITVNAVEKALATAQSGDYFLAQNETSAIPESIALAHQLGLKIALNPAPMTAPVATWPLTLVDYLIVNEIEARALITFLAPQNASSTSQALSPSLPTEGEALLLALHACLPKTTVVVTLGKAGAVAITPEGHPFQQPAFQVKAVDSTAAGDTFTGFLLASLSQNQSLDQALLVASAAAAISVTRPGASSSVPTLTEVTDWLTSQNLSALSSSPC